MFSPIAANAEVNFIFQFADVTASSGIGFDDATTGADRRQALQDVGDYIGGLLDHNATITYTVSASQTDGTGALASAGSSYGLSFETNAIRGSSLAEAIQGDQTATQGQMRVDFGYNWHVGTSAPGNSAFDFRTVLLHEISHSLGFASVIDEVSGEGLNVTQNGNFFGETFSTFDSFLVDGSNTPLITTGPIDFDGTTFTDGADADNVIDVFTGDDLYFNGPNAVAEYGGPVPLYAPSVYNPGSSVSHFDTTDPTLANDPMLHAIAPGVANREYTDLDIAVLEDLGYTIVSAVPEPSSSALLGTAALAMLGMRRRK